MVSGPGPARLAERIDRGAHPPGPGVICRIACESNQPVTDDEFYRVELIAQAKLEQLRGAPTLRQRPQHMLTRNCGEIGTQVFAEHRPAFVLVAATPKARISVDFRALILMPAAHARSHLTSRRGVFAHSVMINLIHQTTHRLASFGVAATGSAPVSELRPSI